MNLLQLPSLTDETAELEGRAERIAFHRTHVRNGPVKFKQPTAGQARRAERRRLRKPSIVARRKHIKGFFDQNREEGVLRGHLQALGLVPLADGSYFTPDDDHSWSRVQMAADWIEAYVGDQASNSHEGFELALERYQTLAAR